LILYLLKFFNVDEINRLRQIFRSLYIKKSFKE